MTVKVVPNAVDRIVGYFDPVAGRERLRARMQMAMAGDWLAGSTDRRSMWHWNPGGSSPDREALYDLPTMRRRSRDMQRNNPVGLGAVNTVVTAAVGTGLSLSSRVDGKALGLSEKETELARQTVEREFALWARDARYCDAESSLDFYALQALAVRSALAGGDVFVTLPMIEHAGCPYGLKLQLIEAERCCNKDNALDSLELAGGIRRDAHGAPLEYHFLRSHPDGYLVAREWDVVPAYGSRTGRRNVLHLFDKRRPGQPRGVPFLAPVIETIKQIGDYTHAEISAAVVASFFTVFVKTKNGSGLGLDGLGGTPTRNPASGDQIKMGPAAIIDLADDEDVAFADPKRPNATIDPFLTMMLRLIGMALEIPFEVLIKHFTASYSASRAALNEAWRFFKGRRAWVAGMLCQPVLEAFMEEAVAIGRIVARGFFEDPVIRAAWCDAEWIGDAPGQIDPLKEVQAARERINGNLSNHAIETMQMFGLEWSQVFAILEAERKRIGPTQPEGAAPASGNKEPNPDKPDLDREED